MTTALVRPAVYLAIPAYNVGWMLRLTAAEREWLTTHPIIVCDVGARGTAPSELEPFEPYLGLHSFDADPDATAELTRSAGRHADHRVFNAMVGERSGRGSFHVFQRPAESSPFPPDSSYREAFSDDDFSIAKTIEVDMVSLDDIYGPGELPTPHMLKLDTQGSELSILRGAELTLSRTVLVEAEVEFVRMYEKQPLYHDVAAHLYERGFELLYLNRVFQQRRGAYTGQARCQVVLG
jgi:FkbM family methyltransferase